MRNRLVGHDSALNTIRQKGTTNFSKSGLVFTKSLRLSQVLGLNLVLKLRLLCQLSFVLKPYSQRVTELSRRLSNNHSGFLCHVTFCMYSKSNIGATYSLFDVFYLRISAVLKWKTLLPHINFQRLL